MIDPICIIHGKRMSEHICLYCCLCFCNLTPETCSHLPNGKKEDVCVKCAEEERAILICKAKATMHTEKELHKTTAFLALVMHNFDGMARGELWQKYRELFPGQYESEKALATIANHE